MHHIRRQLTLFIPADQSIIIEDIRRKYNPEQYQLIKSHITLCREDELRDITLIKQNLASQIFKGIVLSLESAKRFSEGKGVLIPVIDNNGEFQSLRREILKEVIDNPRLHEPHITLMHPRNSTCTDDIFEEIRKKQLPSVIRFDTISLIEQSNGGAWKILDEYALKE